MEEKVKITARLPKDTYDLLQIVKKRTGKVQEKIIAEAIEKYCTEWIKEHKDDERYLIDLYKLFKR